MFLGLAGLTEVFNGSKAAQRGVVESQERGDKDVVEKECAISMGVGVAEVLDQMFERADVLAPADLFGPDGQLCRGLGAPGAV
jgi:hypothetical protein